MFSGYFQYASTHIPKISIVIIRTDDSRVILVITFQKKIKNINQLICIPQREIIATNVPEMPDMLVSQLDNGDEWDELLLDCSRVETLDSIGVNLIIGLHKRAQTENKQFKIVGCHEP